MSREVTRGHEMACRRTACSQQGGTHEGALMHVAAEHAEVLLVLNPPNGMHHDQPSLRLTMCVCCAGRQAAQQHVVAVDAVSRGVDFSMLVMLHADVAASGVAMHLSSAEKVQHVGFCHACTTSTTPPTAALFRCVAGSGGALGPRPPSRSTPPAAHPAAHRLAPHHSQHQRHGQRGQAAPQALHRPAAQRGRRARVLEPRPRSNPHHGALLPWWFDAPHSTSCLLVHDNQCIPEHTSVPAQMAACARRLALSDPDRGPGPPAAKLPWWDDLRMLWRGKAGFKVVWCSGWTWSGSVLLLERCDGVEMGCVVELAS